MTRLKILVQNIGGAGLGREGGGSIAPLRLSIHNKKPEVVILTETRVDNDEYNGKGIFRGYNLTQHSSSERRAAGVMVFIRKGITPIKGTVRNSRDGHYTIGAYDYEGAKIIIGGIYGNCTPSDVPSAEVMQNNIEWHNELLMRLGNVHSIVAGDFNLKLDIEKNSKPRTLAVLKKFMMECDMADAGGEMKAPTWRLTSPKAEVD
jgi:exonuclease III